MRGLTWFRGAVLAVGLLAGPARAADPAPDAVTFRADRLELDPELARLRLSGHVALGAGRYRLTSERLDVVRRPNEVDVTGPGELAFCPCAAPPLTLGFTAARLEPPADVVLEQPTVRAFGVPVFWLPYLWFRTRERWGLLPLELAYRGADGVLLGSGLHLPVGATAVDVSAAGYVRGGVELGARVTTPASESVVRWDYLRESAVTVDLRGATAVSPLASVAWSMDALRGPRALGGPSSLEAVSLRQDRARGAAGWSDGTTTFGVGIMAASARGGALSTVDAVGPSMYAGFGGRIRSNESAAFDLGVTTLARRDAGAVSLLSSRAAIGADAHAGAVAFHIDGKARAMATIDGDRAGYAAVSAVSATVSAPFVRDLGASAGSLVHFVEPIVEGVVGASDTRQPSVVPAAAGDGLFQVGTAGFRTLLGQTASERAALSLSGRGGVVGERADGPHFRGVLAFRASGRARSFAVRGEEISIVSGPDRSDLALATLRVGPEEGLFVEGRGAGMRGTTPFVARLVQGGIDAPAFSWLSASGWSVGGRVGVPWAAWLTSTADADYDVTSQTLLGVRGAVTYRHPCGCLWGTAWAGHRSGRRGQGAGGGAGVDSFLTVGLSR